MKTDDAMQSRRIDAGTRRRAWRKGSRAMQRELKLAPKARGASVSKRAFTLVEIMIVVAIIGIIIAIAVPGFIRARRMSRIRSCQENLVKIHGAKHQWALERNKRQDDVPVWSDLVSSKSQGYLQVRPVEPDGYDYDLLEVDKAPICTSSYPGHAISDIGRTDL
jgi:prepilin-type N-terminal cleavage/methylation domain-containing protein